MLVAWSSSRIQAREESSTSKLLRVNLLPVWILFFSLAQERSISLDDHLIDQLPLKVIESWILLDKCFNQPSSVNEALSSSDYVHTGNPVETLARTFLFICFLYFFFFFTISTSSRFSKTSKEHLFEANSLIRWKQVKRVSFQAWRRKTEGIGATLAGFFPEYFCPPILSAAEGWLALLSLFPPLSMVVVDVRGV